MASYRYRTQLRMCSETEGKKSCFHTETENNHKVCWEVKTELNRLVVFYRGSVGESFLCKKNCCSEKLISREKALLGFFLLKTFLLICVTLYDGDVWPRRSGKFHSFELILKVLIVYHKSVYCNLQFISTIPTYLVYVLIWLAVRYDQSGQNLKY